MRGILAAERNVTRDGAPLASLEKLGMTPKLIGALDTAGYVYLHQLAGLSDELLLGIPNVGVDGLRRVRRVQRKHRRSPELSQMLDDFPWSSSEDEEVCTESQAHAQRESESQLASDKFRFCRRCSLHQVCSIFQGRHANQLKFCVRARERNVMRGGVIASNGG